ncbi:MAG: secondary thiamine-phosphate synthase enzyme YjbQ [Candidatus Hadarchaeales archaeon]
MRVWHKEISFSTRRAREVLDVTDEVIGAFRESGIRDGILVVQLPHATASLVLNESESGLTDDILRKMDELVPVRGSYMHDRIDDNAHAHIKSAIIGSSVVLPVVGGKIVRGTWQNFLVLEEDGPRARRLVVFLMGE